MPVAPRFVPPAAAGIELRRHPRSLGADLVDLRGRETAVAHPLLEELLVLPLPRLAVRDPDVELEILRVVADRRSHERPLEVHVPARKAAIGRLPEQPDRVRVI